MQIKGRVVRGLGIGKKLGYPTANLECAMVQLPAPGVYAAQVKFDDKTQRAVAVVGAREEHGQPLVEAFLLDFEGELLGKELTIEVLDKISDIEQFDNEEALVKKIAQDVKKTRKYFV